MHVYVIRSDNLLRLTSQNERLKRVAIYSINEMAVVWHLLKEK